MEYPAQEIPAVIQALCQGSTQDQKDALQTYFLPDASFQHPLCRVPSLSWNLESLPMGGEVNSRMMIMAIYRWYRLLSPRIDFKIHSTTFNEEAGTLYVDMSQIFAVWFMPFYKAHVRFIIVLTLEMEKPDTSHRREGLQYSDVTAERRPKYLISKQEDHYQLNDTLNFLVPYFHVGPLICRAVQDMATMACIIGVAVCEFFLRVFCGSGQAARIPLAYKPTSRIE